MMIIMRQHDDGQDDYHIINILSCGNWSHLFASHSTSNTGYCYRIRKFVVTILLLRGFLGQLWLLRQRRVLLLWDVIMSNN